MNDAIIKVENLGKCYRIRHQAEGRRYVALRDVIAEKVKGLFGNRKSEIGNRKLVENFWALKDVSFEVKPGEVVGIIGRNGAGKSTLLKLLSRITEPTIGRVILRGRVASLLEVGTGFHPELTGRENIFLNGAILGMHRAEIKRKFDEIVAFAEVEKFLDTPVKRYSSGMYVRLAFAVAAHLEPEILIVDEVLAVGDAAFQKKCMGKMGDVAQQGGRTVIFVSHNMVAVQSLCRRCLYLDRGEIKFDGPADAGVAAYLHSAFEKQPEYVWQDENTAPGNELVRMASISVIPVASKLEARITMQTPVAIETEYWVRKDARLLHITYHLVNEQGIVVLTTGSGSKPYAAGRYRSVCRVPGGLLNNGSYYLNLFIVEDGARVTYHKEEFASFQIVDDQERSEGWMQREPGVVQPLLPWQTEKLGA